MTHKNKIEEIAASAQLDHHGSPSNPPITPYIALEQRSLLRIGEVAALCGVSIKTVQRWTSTEGLPVVRKTAAGARPMLFVRPRDLEHWIAKDLHDSRAVQPDSRIVHLNGRRLLDENRHRRRRIT